MATLAPGQLDDSKNLAFALPTAWERYEILSLLGTGGMGAVYKARDRKLRRIVALKVVRTEERLHVERFLREARAQARIDHDLVCKVYEVGEAHGHICIAMQFINGQPLSSIHPQLSLQEKVELLAGICEAVDAAHEQGIVHRDRSSKTKICLRNGHLALHRRRTDHAFLPTRHLSSNLAPCRT
jgi:serine/threonine-protein kinase